MNLLRLAPAFFLVASLLTQAQQPPPKDKAAIDALVAEEAAAWNAHDAKAFSARFTPDGSFTNIVGETTYGHKLFEEDHQRIFTTIYKDSSVHYEIARLKFLRPDVAVLDLDSHLSGFTRLPTGIQPEPDGRFHCKIQMVLTRDKDTWWIAAFHNVGVMPPPPR